MHRIALLCLLASLVTSTAQNATAQTTRTTHGDTTIARSTGNGLWGAPFTAKEALRIGGESDKTTWGVVREAVALKDGTLAAFDMKGLEGPALRILSPEGKYLRTIGRQGAGPGEYTDQSWIAAGPDGSLWLRDPRNARVTIFNADGTVQRSFVFASGYYGQKMIIPDPAGGVYLAILTGRIVPQQDWPIGFVKMSGTGTVLDTVRKPAGPTLPERSTLWDPTFHWTIMPDGRMLTTRTDQPRIMIHGPGSRTLIIERTVAVVRFEPGERKERQAFEDYNLATLGPNVSGPKPVVPATKPYAREITFDLNGRLWVQRFTPAERIPPRPAFSKPPDNPNVPSKPIPTVSFREPIVYDAFRTDGTYLGEVAFPAGARVMAFSGDKAWGMVTNDDGEPFLVQWKLPSK